MENFNTQLESNEMLAWLRERAAFPGICRSALAREACERLDWRDENGSLREMSCRKRLIQLHKRELIKLPSPRRARPLAKPLAAVKAACVDASLAELGQIELVCVTGKREYSPIWNALMEAHHPLGSGPLCGAQLRYLIKSERYGWLGGLAFSAAAFRLRARDTYLGWTEEERSSKLQHIVCNSRFLIVPTVRVAHLASHVLGLCTRRLPDDWHTQYGYRPWMLETFIDAEHQGTCYRAANWIDVGQTTGRSRQDKSRTLSAGKKRILLHPLEPQRFPRLGHSMVQEDEGERDWADREFDRLAMDKRLVARVKEVARDFFARPTVNIPGACASLAKTKGAYRLLKHEKAKMETLLQSHYRATYERAAQENVVLAVCDTTSLNYSAHAATTGLGTIGSKVDGPIGLMVHETMTFTPEGVPLGLIDVQCWARDPEDFGKKHDRKTTKIEDKESYKWLQSFTAAQTAQAACPQTQVVLMGDRESDVYELFEKARGEKTQFLIRAEQSRCVAEEQSTLWPYMEAQPVAGEMAIQVGRRKAKAKDKAKAKESANEPDEQSDTDAPAKAVKAATAIANEANEASEQPITEQTGRRKAKTKVKAIAAQNSEQSVIGAAAHATKAIVNEADEPTDDQKDEAITELLARTAQLTIRYAQVELKPPATRKYLGNVTVWAIWAREENAPEGVEALDWMLLTSIPTTTFEDACTRLKWYTKRWGIEIYHRILKSGCNIEDRQLGDADSIKACLAIDMVVAWRIMHLVHLGRAVPDAACTVYFSEMQWKALVAFTSKSMAHQKEPPTLNAAIRLVAKLGGFLGRKSDGHPGAKSLWQGLQRLDDISAAYAIFAPPQRPS